MQKFILKEKPSARTCSIRKIDKNHKGFQLKEETTWYYQIQGQMAITGIHHTDLVIYTNKCILIVAVEFNEQSVLDKVLLCFVKFMVPELLSGIILQSLNP